MKTCKFNCRNMGVRDSKTGTVYTADDICKDPKLKKYIERCITENICRVLGASPC